MGTKIQWTDDSWNPLAGCMKVSEGCENCYAERMAVWLSGMGHEKYQRVITAKAHSIGGKQHWQGTVYCDHKALKIPLGWRKGRLIFVCSMSDLFQEAVPFNFVGQLFGIIRKCPHHIFQILTKHTKRMLDYFLANHWNRNLPNVWLGVSVENADYMFRIDQLRQISAATKFISFEPLLSSIPDINLEGIDWVIVGGESGPGARPMHPDWVRNIRDQCKAAGVPFFFKQWGTYKPWFAAYSGADRPASYRPMDADAAIFPDGRIVYHREIKQMSAGELSSLCGGGMCFTWTGKKAAGCLLDGKIYREMPK